MALPMQANLSSTKSSKVSVAKYPSKRALCVPKTPLLLVLSEENGVIAKARVYQEATSLFVQSDEDLTDACRFEWAKVKVPSRVKKTPAVVAIVTEAEEAKEKRVGEKKPRERQGAEGFSALNALVEVASLCDNSNKESLCEADPYGNGVPTPDFSDEAWIQAMGGGGIPTDALPFGGTHETAATLHPAGAPRPAGAPETSGIPEHLVHLVTSNPVEAARRLWKQEAEISALRHELEGVGSLASRINKTNLDIIRKLMGAGT
jgi:hypothetical protein